MLLVAIKQAEEEAIDNAWIRENLNRLEDMQQLERNAFSKEAMYSTDKFRSRLSSSIENSETTVLMKKT